MLVILLLQSALGIWKVLELHSSIRVEIIETCIQCGSNEQYHVLQIPYFITISIVLY